MKMNKKGIQLSNMILGMLFAVGFVVLLFSWIGDGMNQYHATPPSNYNSSFYAVQGIYGNLSSNLNATYSQLQSVNSNTGGLQQVADFIGFFFSSAYRAANVALQSLGSMFTLLDVAIGGLPLGGNEAIIKGLITLGLITLAIALLLRFVFKSGAE